MKCINRAVLTGGFLTLASWLGLTSVIHAQTTQPRPIPKPVTTAKPVIPTPVKPTPIRPTPSTTTPSTTTPTVTNPYLTPSPYITPNPFAPSTSPLVNPYLTTPLTTPSYTSPLTNPLLAYGVNPYTLNSVGLPPGYIYNPVAQSIYNPLGIAPVSSLLLTPNPVSAAYYNLTSVYGVLSNPFGYVYPR